jgi:hypothetical protein
VWGSVARLGDLLPRRIERAPASEGGSCKSAIGMHWESRCPEKNLSTSAVAAG